MSPAKKSRATKTETPADEAEVVEPTSVETPQSHEDGRSFGDPVTSETQAYGQPAAGEDPQGLTAPADGQIEHKVTTIDEVAGATSDPGASIDRSNTLAEGSITAPADGQVEHYVTPRAGGAQDDE